MSFAVLSHGPLLRMLIPGLKPSGRRIEAPEGSAAAGQASPFENLSHLPGLYPNLGRRLLHNLPSLELVHGEESVYQLLKAYRYLLKAHLKNPPCLRS